MPRHIGKEDQMRDIILMRLNLVILYIILEKNESDVTVLTEMAGKLDLLYKSVD